MEATTQTADPLVDLLEDGTIEFNIDVPGPEIFVACEQCPHKDHLGKPYAVRSYMHFYFLGDLLSYCKHHGEKNEEALKTAGASMVADYRPSLIENRLKADA